MKRILLHLILIGTALSCFCQNNIVIFSPEEKTTKITDAEKATVVSEFVNAFSRSDRYIVVDRSRDVQSAIQKEGKYQSDGYVREDQYFAIGEQVGVQYLCIVNFRDSYDWNIIIEARLIDINRRIVVRNTQREIDMYRERRTYLNTVNDMARELLGITKTISGNLAFEGGVVYDYKHNAIKPDQVTMMMMSTPEAFKSWRTSIAIKPIAKTIKVCGWIGVSAGGTIALSGFIQKNLDNTYIEDKKESRDYYISVGEYHEASNLNKDISKRESDLEKHSKLAKTGCIIGGVCLVATIFADYTWKIPAKRAVNKYNSSKIAENLEFHFGGTPNGIGITFVF